MKKCLSFLICAAIFLQSVPVSASSSVIRSGNPDSMKIALTFDDGPHPYKTNVILDLLEQYGIRATFFVVGENVSYYPEPLKRAIALGHEIGNHTYHHTPLSSSCEKTVAEEIEKTEEIIFQTAGYRTTLFRPPEGAFSERSLALLQKMGYRTVCWSFAYADWDPANQMEHQKAFERITRNIHDGEIYLLHAVSETNTAILSDVIDHVRNSGYTFEKYLP